MHILPEVLKLIAVPVSAHGRLALLPVGRADLAMLVEILHSLDHADKLVGVPADRRDIVAGVADYLGGVDYEGAPESDAVGVENPVIRRDFVGLV